jgi:ribosome-binding factor A
VKHRLSRVNEVLQRELGDLIRREFTFAAKLVTVQQVDVTPDLKKAHVYISIIGSLEEQHAAMAQLHDRRPALQAELSRRVVLKFTPHLHFILDAAVERGTRILGILNELGLAPSDEAEIPTGPITRGVSKFDPIDDGDEAGDEGSSESEEDDGGESEAEDETEVPAAEEKSGPPTSRKGRSS